MRKHIVAVAVLLLAVTTPVIAPVTAQAVRAGPPGWPLHPRPEVVRGFEPPPKRWLPGHRGVDLLGSPGQPVLAPLAGTVTYAGILAGRGVVVLSHGTTRTTYEPVRAVVRAGAVVPAGARLGRLSAAGSHCAPRACLHWGLLRGTEYADPLTLTGIVPVRLLPLAGDRAGPLTADGGAADRATAEPAAGADRSDANPAAGAGPPDQSPDQSADQSADHSADYPVPAGERAAGDSGQPAAPARASPGRDLPSYLLVGLAAAMAVAASVMVARH